MRRTATVIAMLLVATPFFASAQVPGICSIMRTLQRGSSGTDVSALQAYLSQRGHFSLAPTGYFGSITETALANWQLQVGIITKLSDGGVFGPRTRAYVLVNVCATATVKPPVINTGSSPKQCVPPLQPTDLTCPGTWKKMLDGTGCHTGWTCEQSATTTAAGVNKPPVIVSLTGITNLSIGESSTWTVVATDPENDPLLFSAVFGDEGTSLSQLLNISQQGTPYSSARTFTHAYKKGGIYTIVVFAKDTSGNTTKGTLTVTVPIPVESAAGRSCTLNGATTSNGGSVANPSCTLGSCEFARLLCVDGTWIAVRGDSTPKVFACYMGGQGFDAETVPAECQSGAGIGDYTQPGKAECDRYSYGKPLCTAEGWQNVSWGLGRLNSRNITVGCTTSNGIHVPGNRRVMGSFCFVDDPTAKNCDRPYVCQRDGWHELDSGGFDLGKRAAPWVAPETFY